jgi:hypothetical protein
MLLRGKHLFLLAALATAGAAQAQLEHQLADCARIAGSTERLACYDALSDARGDKAGTWNRAFGPDASRTAPLAAEPTVLAPGPAADFGFEGRDAADDVQQIQSRYDGEFTGWSGNTLFRLENGQVWKQSQSGRIAYRATRPAVTIRRSTLGAYRMSVQGLDQSVRVERVK